jgi:hypothetical protein
MAVFAVDLSLAGSASGGGDALQGVLPFLGTLAHWRIIIDLFAIALSGGIFVVPLYALMQARSDERHRARVIAANNVLNALFMVVAGIASAIILQLGFGVRGVFAALALGSVIVTAVSFRRR